MKRSTELGIIDKAVDDISAIEGVLKSLSDEHQHLKEALGLLKKTKKLIIKHSNIMCLEDIVGAIKG